MYDHQTPLDDDYDIPTIERADDEIFLCRISTASRYYWKSAPGTRCNDWRDTDNDQNNYDIAVGYKRNIESAHRERSSILY